MNVSHNGDANGVDKQVNFESYTFRGKQVTAKELQDRFNNGKPNAEFSIPDFMKETFFR